MAEPREFRSQEQFLQVGSDIRQYDARQGQDNPPGARQYFYVIYIK
jgi:hypothetical protein